MKDNIKNVTKNIDTYVLPSNNTEMETFINNNKIDIMEHIVSSIDSAVKNKSDTIVIFEFYNSPYIVTISNDDFKDNLSNILNYYKKNELYELCSRIENILNNLHKK